MEARRKMDDGDEDDANGSEDYDDNIADHNYKGHDDSGNDDEDDVYDEEMMMMVTEN